MCKDYEKRLLILIQKKYTISLSCNTYLIPKLNFTLKASDSDYDSIYTPDRSTHFAMA